MRLEDETNWPILICLLGDFRLLKMGHPLTACGGAKTEALFCALGTRYRDRVPRDVLLSMLWPGSDPALADQSLNSLVHALHKHLGDAIGGATPVLHTRGYYRLNVEAGVSVDVACFEALADAGDRQTRMADCAAAAVSYRRAVRLYRGDLCAGTNSQALVYRECLRARYLSLLARLAEHHYGEGDYVACWDYAQRMLRSVPCREDAYRLAMRCHVRQGERAEALRQYRLCVKILRTEFETEPELATTALFEQIRLDPRCI
jgi:DNA-binding SARP family transcriptional activator